MKTAIEVTPLRKWLAARMAEGRATLGTWLEQRGFDETEAVHGSHIDDEISSTAMEALDSVRRAAKADGLRNAHIIPGPCATCGGSGKCPICDGQGEVLTEDRSAHTVCYRCEGSGTCPDCPLPSIVPEDVWEKAGKEYWESTRLLRVTELNDVQWEDLSRVRRIEMCEEAWKIVSVTLGPVRMAKAVYRVWSYGDYKALIGVGTREDDGNPEGLLTLGPEEEFALLHPEAK